MADVSQTFSESWHRVAHQRVSLRRDVRIRRQTFRREKWIVLENPLSNQFFRIRPATYQFIARLNPAWTVEEVWKECIRLFPAEAPGQEAVIQLLAQLHRAGLLHYDAANDTAGLFRRRERQQRQDRKNTLLNIMFYRFPLFDPDRFLRRNAAVGGVDHQPDRGRHLDAGSVVRGEDRRGSPPRSLGPA